MRINSWSCCRLFVAVCSVNDEGGVLLMLLLDERDAAAESLFLSLFNHRMTVLNR